MELAVLRQAFDRGDGRGFRLRCEHRARPDRGSVHHHDAAAALGRLAADMGSGESQGLTQIECEERAVLDLARDLLAIDRHRYRDHECAPAARTCWMAVQILTGVAGIVISTGLPMLASASSMALMMTAGAGVVPPSPPAFTPNGLVGDSTAAISVLNEGMLSKRGM